MSHRPTRRRADGASSAWHFVPGGLGLLWLLFANIAAALQPDEAAAMLKKADSIKISDHAQFTALLKSLDEQSKDLSPAQREYVRFLEGWSTAYEGDYETAIPRLEEFTRDSRDLALRLRAGATVVNMLALAKHYDEAFSRLSQVLQMLPQVSDQDAREQAVLDAAQLYNEVGQYDLGLKYAQMVIDENWAGRGICKGGQVKLRALYESGKLTTVGAEFQAGIDACIKSAEPTYANSIRTYIAKLHISQGRFDDAIDVLQKHYDESLRSRFPRLISQFNALLGRAYQKKGNAALAQQFATRAVESAVKNEYTEPLATAYRVLYELAKAQGEFETALACHEKYTAADKGYLDGVSAGHLAFQRVKHESLANELQIETLNKQNQVLQLERALDAKAVENSRLYILLLVMILGFIGLWAYRTKRSQLHFMSLSQLDGLTGIANRPHFIKQAESALENSRKTQQEASIVLCDLDHFKAINDKYGHAAGDLVLKRTVSACRAHLREDEVFGRFGGEEFGILLPRCGAEEARQRSEQLRTTIAGITTNHGGAESRISASFGIATTSACGYELRHLLAHADAALYEAKRIGRNCIVLHDATGAVEQPATTTDERLRDFGRRKLRDTLSDI